MFIRHSVLAGLWRSHAIQNRADDSIVTACDAPTAARQVEGLLQFVKWVRLPPYATTGTLVPRVQGADQDPLQVQGMFDSCACKHCSLSSFLSKTTQHRIAATSYHGDVAQMVDAHTTLQRSGGGFNTLECQDDGHSSAPLLGFTSFWFR